MLYEVLRGCSMTHDGKFPPRGRWAAPWGPSQQHSPISADLKNLTRSMFVVLLQGHSRRQVQLRRVMAGLTCASVVTNKGKCLGQERRLLKGTHSSARLSLPDLFLLLLQSANCQVQTTCCILHQSCRGSAIQAPLRLILANGRYGLPSLQAQNELFPDSVRTNVC